MNDIQLYILFLSPSHDPLHVLSLERELYRVLSRLSVGEGIGRRPVLPFSTILVKLPLDSHGALPIPVLWYLVAGTGRVVYKFTGSSVNSLWSRIESESIILNSTHKLTYRYSILIERSHD